MNKVLKLQRVGLITPTVVEYEGKVLATNHLDIESTCNLWRVHFGFYPTEETWDYSSDPVLRTIHEVELYEVSIVSLPAYEDTEAALARNKQEMKQDIKTRKKLIEKIKTALEA